MNFDPASKDLGFVLVVEIDLDLPIRICLSETPDYWRFDSLNWCLKTWQQHLTSL